MRGQQTLPYGRGSDGASRSSTSMSHTHLFSAVRHGCLRRIGWFSPKNGSLGSKGGAVSAEFHIFSRSPRVRPEHWTLWLSVLTKKKLRGHQSGGPRSRVTLRWTLPLEAVAQRELQGA